MIKKINNFLISLFERSSKTKGDNEEPEEKNKKEDKWNPPKEYCDKINLEEVKFIHEHANIGFNNTIEVSKTIADRSTVLLSVIIGIIIGLVTYSIDREDKGKYDALFFTTVFGAIYYFYIGVNNFIINIKPFEYKLPGTTPDKYFSGFFFDISSNDNKREIRFYLTEIKSLQYKIKFNRQLNERRWDMYNDSLKQLLCSPIIIALIFIIIEIMFIILKKYTI